MRRTLGIAAVLCLMFAGESFAGRHGRGHGSAGANGGVVVRESGPRRPVVVRGGGHARVQVSNGRYVFPGGVVRTYRRPRIRERYYDVHVRPAVVVEQYDPVPGYVWVAGSWSWGGREWIWAPGYWAVADAPPPPPPPQAPAVNGGVSISAGFSIH